MSEDEKADPYKIAALPKMKLVVRFFSLWKIYVKGILGAGPGSPPNRTVAPDDTGVPRPQNLCSAHRLPIELDATIQTVVFDSSVD